MLHNFSLPEAGSQPYQYALFIITFIHFLHRSAFTAEPFISDSLERTIESSWKQALLYIGRLIPFFHEISCGLCIIPSSITLLQYGHVIAYTS